ncbi:hypothetical protein GVAV_002454 [Gurleya vavrai]
MKTLKFFIYLTSLVSNDTKSKNNQTQLSRPIGNPQKHVSNNANIGINNNIGSSNHQIPNMEPNDNQNFGQFKKVTTISLENQSNTSRTINYVKNQFQPNFYLENQVLNNQISNFCPIAYHTSQVFEPINGNCINCDKYTTQYKKSLLVSDVVRTDLETFVNSIPEDYTEDYLNADNFQSQEQGIGNNSGLLELRIDATEGDENAPKLNDLNSIGCEIDEKIQELLEKKNSNISIGFDMNDFFDMDTSELEKNFQNNVHQCPLGMKNPITEIKDHKIMHSDPAKNDSLQPFPMHEKLSEDKTTQYRTTSIQILNRNFPPENDFSGTSQANNHHSDKNLKFLTELDMVEYINSQNKNSLIDRRPVVKLKNRNTICPVSSNCTFPQANIGNFYFSDVKKSSNSNHFTNPILPNNLKTNSNINNSNNQANNLNLQGNTKPTFRNIGLNNRQYIALRDHPYNRNVRRSLLGTFDSNGFSTGNYVNTSDQTNVLGGNSIAYRQKKENNSFDKHQDNSSNFMKETIDQSVPFNTSLSPLKTQNDNYRTYEINPIQLYFQNVFNETLINNSSQSNVDLNDQSENYISMLRCEKDIFDIGFTDKIACDGYKAVNKYLPLCLIDKQIKFFDDLMITATDYKLQNWNFIELNIKIFDLYIKQKSKIMYQFQDTDEFLTKKKLFQEKIQKFINLMDFNGLNIFLFNYFEYFKELEGKKYSYNMNTVSSNNSYDNKKLIYLKEQKEIFAFLKKCFIDVIENNIKIINQFYPEISKFVIFFSDIQIDSVPEKQTDFSFYLNILFLFQILTELDPLKICTDNFIFTDNQIEIKTTEIRLKICKNNIRFLFLILISPFVESFVVNRYLEIISVFDIISAFINDDLINKFIDVNPKK